MFGILKCPSIFWPLTLDGAIGVTSTVDTAWGGRSKLYKGAIKTLDSLRQQRPLMTHHSARYKL